MSSIRWRKSLPFAIFWACSLPLAAQTQVSLAQAMTSALAKHPAIRGAQTDLETLRALQKAGWELPNLVVYTEAPSSFFYTIGIQQGFESPAYYFQKGKLRKEETQLAMHQVEITKLEVLREVANAYINLQWLAERKVLLGSRDSLYQRFKAAALRRYQAGDADLIEWQSAEVRAAGSSNELEQLEADWKHGRLLLALSSGLDGIPDGKLGKGMALEIRLDSAGMMDNPYLDYQRQAMELALQAQRMERAKKWPGFYVGYINQGDRESQVQYRFQAGLSIPVAWWAISANNQAAALGVDAAQARVEQAGLEARIQLEEALNAYHKAESRVAFHELTALKQADVLVDAATRSYDAGYLDYISLLNAIDQAFSVRLAYLDARLSLQQALLQYQLLTSKFLQP
jgi:outer membrane protein TolC